MLSWGDDRMDVRECDCGTCPGCEADKGYEDDMVLCCTLAAEGKSHAPGCPLTGTTHSVSYRGFEVRRGAVGEYLCYERGNCIGIARSVELARQFLNNVVRS
jgi:hypothetical protein